MDPIDQVLASNRAVAQMGGNAGGEVGVIYLSEFGIDLVSFVLAGGGVMSKNGTKEMWERITVARGNVKFAALMGDGFFYLTPMVVAYDAPTDRYTSASLCLAVGMDSAIVKGDISLTAVVDDTGFTGRTVILAAITQADLS